VKVWKSFIIALFGTITALPIMGQSADVVTVGTVAGVAGSAVDVPVYIRDVSGTPLGMDQPFGSRIQSYGITVNYPTAAIQSVTFTRAGITAPLTPSFESNPSTPGSITLLDVFQESTNLIPFTSNAPAPGNQIGVLHVVISPAAPAGPLTLTLASTLTQLSNQSGTITERTTLSTLQLVSGAIAVSQPTPVPALSPWALTVMALLIGVTALIVLRR